MEARVRQFHFGVEGKAEIGLVGDSLSSHAEATIVASITTNAKTLAAA